MTPTCPHCTPTPQPSDPRPAVVRAGTFRRRSDGRRVQRFRCKRCRRHFSGATTHACTRQKKRQVNYKLWRNLCSGMSLRRAAREMKLSRTTVARKLIFLGERAIESLRIANEKHPRADVIEFDDLETFEHSKCKPLSITLAVEHGTRRILDFEVSQMPARGPLTGQARARYGARPDERKIGRERLFGRLQKLVAQHVRIKSDENPHYAPDVRRHFPSGTHESFKGQRGAMTGQGELKRVRFDPLFSLNHTCAMLRANVNRLFRRTWCTTKRKDRLAAHVGLYALYHNQVLLEASPRGSPVQRAA